MKFENKGFESMKAELNRLDDVMLDYGLVREGQWDFERVTYDRKFELNEGVFYLRVQGYAVEGDVGAGKALIQLKTPLLGKHYYPHGVEYGDGESFPKSLVAQCEKILTNIQSEIAHFAK
ncbi:YugN family protein [Bacillus tuaregi]|uniref:YugN family protein n=1 Tax=Bacillus tuaregi TaxID=1816695 RepID=UPI0008F8FC6C|nr:YugN family protein [Bacillus tuaregi]